MRIRLPGRHTHGTGRTWKRNSQPRFPPPYPLARPVSTRTTTYDVNTNAAFWQIYPHRWDGKLTFTTPGGGASCSATAISGNNFVTAAHCVYDTAVNQFYANWVFTPAFRNGSAPYGSFSATACTILTAWVNLSGGFSINSWTRYDVAVCSVGSPLAFPGVTCGFLYCDGSMT